MNLPMHHSIYTRNIGRCSQSSFAQYKCDYAMVKRSMNQQKLRLTCNRSMNRCRA
jgi:hypothetical protein